MKTKFEIRFTPRFLRNIKVLDRKVQARILREINILKTNPYVGKPLRGEFEGIYSLRIRDYRVLYQIKEEKEKVYLLVVSCWSPQPYLQISSKS